MNKRTYDAKLCEVLGVSGPMGFVNSQVDGSMLEVWKTPGGQYLHLVPSDLLNDRARTDQFNLVCEQLRND